MGLLWEELHHHGLLGEAAYGIVPYLAVCAGQVAEPPWQVFGFPVIVELARFNPENPRLPRELEISYRWAFRELPCIAPRPAWR